MGTTTLAGGKAFSATLLSILVAHEMGHYLVARYHGVEASLPHFIPLPPFFILGTLGAVITMRTDRAERNQLLDIGAAGPIAGFLVAVPAMILGIHLSREVSVAGGGPITFFGDSILSGLLVKLLRPELAAGHDLEAHPVMIGAWAGFMVTAINLLPLGQLDGGHVLYAWSPANAERWGRRIHRLLLVLGLIGVLVHGPTILYALLDLVGVGGTAIPRALFDRLRPLYPWVSFGSLIWAFLGKATGLRHPPVRDLDQPLTPARRAAAIACLLIALLTFMPNPVWVDGIWLAK